MPKCTEILPILQLQYSRIRAQGMPKDLTMSVCSLHSGQGIAWIPKSSEEDSLHEVSE